MKGFTAQKDAPRNYFAVDIEKLTPANGPDSWADATSPTGVLRIERDGTTVDEVTGTATTNGNELYAEYTHTVVGTDYVQWFVTVSGKTEPGEKIPVTVVDVVAAEA